MSIESILYSIFGFLIATSLLVTLHEWGHYYVAKLCGVKILRFSIGFGPTLWSRCVGPDQTEWKVSVLPFGGYVQFLSERDETHPVLPEEKHRAFENKAPWQRIAIIAAGPIMNLLLAVVIYSLVFCVGIEQDRPRFAAPAAESLLAKAGVHDRGEIVAWNNAPVQSLQDMQWLWFQEIGQSSGILNLEVKTLRGTRRLQIPYAQLPQGEDFMAWLESLGIEPDMPAIIPIISEVLPGQPAALAGLKPGDQITKIEGRAIGEWRHLMEALKDRADKNTRLEYSREGKTLSVQIIPKGMPDRKGVLIGKIGVAPKRVQLNRSDYTVLVRYPLGQSIAHGAYKTYELTKMTLLAIGKMVTGEISLKNISGPVRMADMAGKSLQAGWVIYLSYLGLISVSLGVMNLLPIPVLDGGHIVYETLAILRGGKPVSVQWVMVGQKLGLLILGSMMLLAFFNDWSHFVK
ncbi:MAG: RIP metalloprotease RseP [Pseudomonadota bacterium]